MEIKISVPDGLHCEEYYHDKKRCKFLDGHGYYGVAYCKIFKENLLFCPDEKSRNIHDIATKIKYINKCEKCINSEVK